MLPEFYTDDGSGTPLLLFHAYPLNAAMWEAQRHSLVTDVRLLTFDLPGFGRGGPVPPDFDLRRGADMAAALLDFREIDRAVIGGLSMGGYLAMAMLRHHPARVLGLLLANTKAGADSEEGKAGRMEQIARIDAGELPEVLEGMLPRMLGVSTQEVAPEVVSLVQDLMRSATPDGCRAMLAAMAGRENSEALLSSCTVPVCSIGGAEDVLIPPAEAEHIAALAPESELHILRNSGHLSNLERPVLFATAVRNYMKRFH